MDVIGGWIGLEGPKGVYWVHQELNQLNLFESVLHFLFIEIINHSVSSVKISDLPKMEEGSLVLALQLETDSGKSIS